MPSISTKGGFEGARRLCHVAIQDDAKVVIALLYFRGMRFLMHDGTRWELAVRDFNTALSKSPGFFWGR